MRYRVLLLVMIGLFVWSSVHADVPRLINFQGRLTDVTGKFVSDGNYSVTFRLYKDSTGGGAIWSEVQSVEVSKGLFNVMLGSVTPIPDSIFSHPDVFLGVQIAADPEMIPRQRFSSTGYAYRGAKSDTSSYSKDSDKLDGLQASSFCSIATDYGRPGAAINLYEELSTLTEKYVNVSGPDSVVSESGTAFTGGASGSSTSSLYGIQGYGDNTFSGNAYGGYFYTSYNGTGLHFGVDATAYSASAAAYGVSGYADNISGGPAYGGYFSTSSYGTGLHYGSYSKGQASSSKPAYGTYVDATNSSSGRAYGGYFQSGSPGTGKHYGLRAVSYGSSDSSTYGCDAFAVNNLTGNVYGGYFTADSPGSGYHYGLVAEGKGGSAILACGLSASAENTSSGPAFAGAFYVGSSGTGTHQAINAFASGNSISPIVGVQSYADNLSSGSVYGGYFFTGSGGGGTSYGLYSSAPSTGYAGYFDGNLLAVNGTKSAAVKVDNGEYRLLYSMESPENWFEDFGEGQLVDGKAIVQIDPLFAQSVNTSVKYHVFLTPGGDCNGLYATNKTPSSFEVKELKSGNSNLSFSYRIVAKRKGYEDLRMAKMLGSTPEEIQAEQAKRRPVAEEERARMTGEGERGNTEQEIQ